MNTFKKTKKETLDLPVGINIIDGKEYDVKNVYNHDTGEFYTLIISITEKKK